MTCRTILLLICFFLITFLSSAQKPRLLITTDIGGDPDDRQSLIRLLTYANAFEMEGFISSAAGTPGELRKAVVMPELILEIIDAYARVWPNLKKHDPGYPEPEKLKALIKQGNPLRGWENVGQDHDTEASEWIIRQADKKDKRPLNICIFGGQTDLAQALWKVKNSRSAEKYLRFISRLRIYDINDQDKIFSNIIREHPGLFYILAKAPAGQDRREGAYRGMYLGGDENLTSLAWIKENICENHGPLGGLYPLKTWTDPNPHGVMKEGDTPSWFFFLENGLNLPEQPELGGWGGRFLKDENGIYRDAADSLEGTRSARATVYRWREEFQRDWAARMDWCVKEVPECNHAPLPSVNGSTGQKPLMINTRRGKTVHLNAVASTDPDGHSIHFEWSVYPFDQPGSSIFQMEPGNPVLKLSIPGDCKSPTLPLLLKVSDSGFPPLTSYKRIFIAIKK